jgi:PAS domain S-box-containing protein
VPRSYEHLATSQVEIFRRIFMNAPVAVMSWNHDNGVIRGANPTMCAITGYTAADLTGRQLSELCVDMEDIPDVGTVFETPFLHRSGQFIWLRFTTLLTDARVVVAFIENVSERREIIALERDLFRAIERSELVQYYQPIVELATNHVVGMEALLRWQRNRLISAGEFMGVAEQTDAIVAIGDWTLGQACYQQVVWREMFGAIPDIGVNVSGRETALTNVTDRILSAASAIGADLSDLTIEFTEHTYVETVQTFFNGLHALRDSGVQIALDDFGTGFSSMAYLKRFPIDFLKIDQSFIAGLGHSRDDAAIVRSIISLAHSLDLAVIAEGVEHVRQLEMLRAWGCDAIQGYLVARPLSAADATDFLAERLAPT